MPKLRQDGLSEIAQSTVAEIRRDLGLRLCTEDPEAQATQRAQIEEVIQQETQQGDRDGLRRVLLQVHLRQEGHVFLRYVY